MIHLLNRNLIDFLTIADRILPTVDALESCRFDGRQNIQWRSSSQLAFLFHSYRMVKSFTPVNTKTLI